MSRYPLLDHPLHSRVHPLRDFAPLHSCYVKRDDELSFGISGSKLRKYASLLPAFLKESPEEAIVIGSAYSNHVVSLTQLLIEKGIDPLLFLLGSEKSLLQGNLLLSSLFVKPENIYWYEKKTWDTIEETALEFAKKRTKKCVMIPRGANTVEALPGAMTLALDILENERKGGISFDHIFIDSGTGMTAAALTLAFGFLEKKTTIHILQIAGTPEEFHTLLSLRKTEFEGMIQQRLPSSFSYKLYSPTHAQSFGSVSPQIFQTIREIAHTQGFLTDPIFTAKLFAEGKKILSEKTLKGNILFIHSGGALSLMGFTKQLKGIE
jgi:1-aminocyclopropane-1-carboxylate deaminase